MSFGRGCPGGDSTVRRSVCRTWIAGVWALLFCLTYLDCWNLGSFVLFDVLGLLEFELFCAYLFSLAYSDCSLSLSLSSSSSSSSSICDLEIYFYSDMIYLSGRMDAKRQLINQFPLLTVKPQSSTSCFMCDYLNCFRYIWSE